MEVSSKVSSEQAYTSLQAYLAYNREEYIITIIIIILNLLAKLFKVKRKVVKITTLKVIFKQVSQNNCLVYSWLNKTDTTSQKLTPLFTIIFLFYFFCTTNKKFGISNIYMQ